MKKALIVIMDMGIGGAQKSLLAFLEGLAARGLTDHEIHLMVVKPTGALMEQIPACIRRVEPPKTLRWLGTPVKLRLLLRCPSLKGLWGKFLWLVRKRSFRGLNRQQRLWSCWHKLIPENKTHYDTAISYMDGYTNYYVMDKVRADRKILWVHNEYQKQGCDPDYDRRFYEDCHAIVTISDNCRSCILEQFPRFAAKTHVLENITSHAAIVKKSELGDSREFAGVSGLKLLSVGRLHYLKGFDLAIEAARLLRERGISFLWLVVGDGPERQTLQTKIHRYGLEDCFRLIGAKENPYADMKACDILVQPSRSEGKSMVLDEARVLGRPVVATDYTTVQDSVLHGQTGLIVDMIPEAVAEGIMTLWQDTELYGRICQNLCEMPKGNEDELDKYVQIML